MSGRRALLGGGPGQQASGNLVVYSVTYRQWKVTADSCTIPEELQLVFDQLEGLLAQFN